MDVRPGAIDQFAARMNRIALDLLTEDDLRPALTAEVEVAATAVSLKMLDELSVFEPWGRGNPEPLFMSRNSRIDEVIRMGADKQHLKLKLSYDGMPAPEAVMWNAGDREASLAVGRSVDICYRPQPNTWNGTTRVQLQLVAIRPSDVEEW